MKIYKINSKKFGNFDVYLDDKDFELLQQVGGKWGVCKMRDKFYVQKRFSDDKVKQLHRFLLGEPKGKYIDHINGNPLDNRRKNLRVCTNSANLRNARIRPNNSSGYSGVYRVKDQPLHPWLAQIRVKYKVIRLGSFKTFKEAVKARKQAEIKYWNI